MNRNAGWKRFVLLLVNLHWIFIAIKPPRHPTTPPLLHPHPPALASIWPRPLLNQSGFSIHYFFFLTRSHVVSEQWRHPPPRPAPPTPNPPPPTPSNAQLLGKEKKKWKEREQTLTLTCLISVIWFYDYYFFDPSHVVQLFSSEMLLWADTFWVCTSKLLPVCFVFFVFVCFFFQAWLNWLRHELFYDLCVCFPLSWFYFAIVFLSVSVVHILLISFTLIDQRKRTIYTYIYILMSQVFVSGENGSRLWKR